jgi:hypothetical protein
MIAGLCAVAAAAAHLCFNRHHRCMLEGLELDAMLLQEINYSFLRERHTV